MAIVQTVLGPIDTDKLGPTLVHEHVLFSYPGDTLDPTSTWSRADAVEVAVERMQGLLDQGVRTFVDPCPIECGRDPELMAEIAERSGMQIVCATGFYYEDIGIPYYWRLRTVEEITELFLHEIANGIGSTGIKPGIVKIASSSPPTDLEKKVITAAAIAARESGLTVISHCEHATGAEIQQEILVANDVDLGRCMIGHQDEAEKPQQLVEIAERGSFVGVDRIGYEILAPDDHRVELITGVLAAGFADNLCLSQDHLCSLPSPRLPFRVPKELEPFIDQALPLFYEQLYRRPHTYLFTDFWPKLEAAGVARATFDAILTDNPRRLFGG
jgi:phosphotriesterase-related protein